MSYYKTVIRPFSALECHSTTERTLTQLKIGINVFYGCDHDYSNRRFFLKVYEINSQWISHKPALNGSKMALFLPGNFFVVNKCNK